MNQPPSPATPTQGPYHVADIIAGLNGRYGIDDAEGHHLAVIKKHHYDNPLPDQANAELFAAAPETAAERDRLRLEIEQCHAKSTCCCGDYMKHHSTYSGHNPVSMYDNALFNVEAERDRLVVVNEGLMALLQEALPHVEQMANELATGPIAGPVEHLAEDMGDAILAALTEARKP